MMIFKHMYKNNLNYLNYIEIDKLVNNFEMCFDYTSKQYIYNIPCSFDIETTSTYSKTNEKIAFMYIWQFGINGNVYIGRTWDEFLYFYKKLCVKLNTRQNTLIVYVHNLSYEFQFIRKLLKWENVFSIESRKPLKAVTIDNIEFRCSYMLSGYSLEYLGNMLHTYKIKKLVGNLDYKLIRHSKTKLSDEEINYCINDVLVVMSYIQELIEEYGNLSLLPLTKTGFVRKYVRKNVLGFSKKRDWDYFNLMRNLTISNVKEFKQLKRAFLGGFTHANAMFVNTELKNVASFDFTSSYPYVMCSEKFPMSKAINIDYKIAMNKLDYYLNNFCCVFDVLFYNIKPLITYENIISSSRTFVLKNSIINNGRVVSADLLGLTTTDVDFKMIRKFYNWDKFKIRNFKLYKKDYLPKKFIQSILQLYKDKTTLKNVNGKEKEYLNSKEQLNSCYGMCVTNPIKDKIDYNNDWCVEKSDYVSELTQYNNDKNRFLFYPWGIWVTAYARRNLYSAIIECKYDYVYSDTDSVKIRNYETHLKYFENYNDEVINKLSTMCGKLDLDVNLIKPKTCKGVEKILGVWDFEGVYDRFKTLGAKRYIYEENGNLHITVSGLAKKDGINYLLSQDTDVFKLFNDGLYIPKGNCGKMVHTYLDNGNKGVIKDYNNIISSYEEKSCVHLDDCDFSLTMGRMFLDYLRKIKFEKGCI